MQNKSFLYLMNRFILQEEFAPYWGSSTGVVARFEGLRGRMSEAERQVEGSFESLLSESFEIKN